MNKVQLLYYSQSGLIPAPNENEEDFIIRAQYCLNIKSYLIASKKKEFENVADPPLLMHSVYKKAQHLYDISPTWAPVIFSKKGLLPWHAGSTWIFQLKANEPTCALLQLNPKWRKTEEVALHEICHIGRFVFNEPKFEEILAYRSSKSSFRSYLGALVQNKVESLLFMITLALIFLIDLYVLLNGTASQMLSLSWLKALPALMMSFALSRNFILQCKLNAALKNIAFYTSHPMAVVYRLTDEEILQFAKWDENKIKKYIDAQTSLRWQMIHLYTGSTGKCG